MDYPHENDLRQIARPDGRRVLESYIAGDWRELVGIEIVGTRLRDSGATAHLTLSVKLPCIIIMPSARPARPVGAMVPPSSGVGFPIARTRVDLDRATSSVFTGDAAALADEIVASRPEPCAIVIEQGGFEELARSPAEGVPPLRAARPVHDAFLPGDDMIEPRGGRYPAKRSR